MSGMILLEFLFASNEFSPNDSFGTTDFLLFWASAILTVLSSLGKTWVIFILFKNLVMLDALLELHFLGLIIILDSSFIWGKRVGLNPVIDGDSSSCVCASSIPQIIVSVLSDKYLLVLPFSVDSACTLDILLVKLSLNCVLTLLVEL